jgi:hypothetical protein
MDFLFGSMSTFWTTLTLRVSSTLFARARWFEYYEEELRIETRPGVLEADSLYLSWEVVGETVAIDESDDFTVVEMEVWFMRACPFLSFMTNRT